MKVASGKNKGRKLQQWVRKQLIGYFGFYEEDIKSTPGGVSGPDISLSSDAQKVFPYAIECKNQERLGIWKAWEQTEKNARQEKLKPLLIIKRNHQEPLVVLEFDDFMRDFL